MIQQGEARRACQQTASFKCTEDRRSLIRTSWDGSRCVQITDDCQPGSWCLNNDEFDHQGLPSCVSIPKCSRHNNAICGNNFALICEADQFEDLRFGRLSGSRVREIPCKGHCVTLDESMRLTRPPSFDGKKFIKARPTSFEGIMCPALASPWTAQQADVINQLCATGGGCMPDRLAIVKSPSSDKDKCKLIKCLDQNKGLVC